MNLKNAEKVRTRLSFSVLTHRGLIARLPQLLLLSTQAASQTSEAQFEMCFCKTRFVMVITPPRWQRGWMHFS